jgi:histone deacetylase complex regulatory component SIN3
MVNPSTDKINAIKQKDALAFLDEIRKEFPNDNQVFQAFVNIMADFKTHK